MAQSAPLPAFSAPIPSAVEARRLGDEGRHAFLRTVSHELRTPLNSIIGFAEILNRELCGPIGSPQYKDYAGLIGQSGRQLLKLVNQILDIIRLEDRGAEIDLAPESLEALVSDAFQQVQAEAEPRRITLHLDRASPLPDVMVDARAIQTVLVNLLQNAIAAAPEGSEIQVRGHGHAGRFTIEVQDQGPGVAPEDLDRILRPFEQGGQVLTRSSSGAGLGLPIARLLCEAMGGRLDLRSTPGQGLVALVTLAAA